MQQPVEVRSRAIRLAMNAWLAADGAAAIAAAREDPALGDLVEPMMQLALYVYPRIFLDDPALLEGVPNVESLITSAVTSIATFDSEVARALIDRHLSGSGHADAMLSSVEWIGERNDRPPSAEDAYAELESILSEQNSMKRRDRLRDLVFQVAEHDPATAAELIDGMPRSSATGDLIQTLIFMWSEADPEQAAHWVMNKSARVAGEGLRHVAQQWGHRDFDMANAFADSLTDAQRGAFLSGLAIAAGRMSIEETRAWLSRYEDEPVYPELVSTAARQVAIQDFGAAVELIEAMPEQSSAMTMISLVAMSTLQDPEDAIAVIDGIENETVRDALLPVVYSSWAQYDSESALNRAIDLPRGSTRDQAIASVALAMMEFDLDGAIDAIGEIDEVDERGVVVQRLLFLAESDDEAVRIGRGYDFDRDAVLRIRAVRSEFGASYFSGGEMMSILSGPVVRERPADADSD